jgi:putative transposase
MLLTTSIKLLATADQKKSLLQSMYQFNSACNWISQYAFKEKVFSKVKLQKVIYYELREKFHLPAQFAIRAISRVAESYKLNKKVEHKFKKTSSVEYDQRILNWKKLDTISILSLDGRLSIQIVFGEYAKLNERAIKNSAKLIYRNKQFYLQAVVEVPEANLQETQDFLGVDLGIVNLATTSTGQVYSGAQVDAVRQRYTILKAGLQSCGSKSAKRHLKKISGKEGRFKRNTNHIISKQIVQQAKALGFNIALEELKGFKKTVRKAQREQFGKWAFGQLAMYIEYKAKIAGVQVVKVDPKNTSRTCSECGYCHKLNRSSQSVFKCRSCGFTINADLNAAYNIAARAVVNRLIAANQQ